MPRGKNYVNNNKGMSMEATKKKKGPSMEQCFYGAGCTRKDCIYRHDGASGEPQNGQANKSNEPCMPFLAGQCTFSAKGCKKRHPNKEEADKLIAKYKATKCRYGDHCKTTGCLYIHPKDNDGGVDLGGTAAFPPLVSSGTTNTNGGAAAGAATAQSQSSWAPSGAWKPMQPTGAAVVQQRPPAMVMTPPQQQQQQPMPTATTTNGGPSPAAAVPKAWGPSQPAPVWGQPRNPVVPQQQQQQSNPAAAAARPVAVTPVPGNGTTPAAAPAPSKPPMSFAAAAQKQQQQPPPKQPEPPSSAAAPSQPQPSAETSLNIHAKEFVPSFGY